MSTSTTQANLFNPRPCQRCKGEGRTHNAWAKENGYEGPEGKLCLPCKGSGQFEGLEVDAIVERIFLTKGGKKSLRKSFASKGNRFENRLEGRAYFVWRLARFHGGADVTMPITADVIAESDPFKPELNVMANEVAKMAFGTDMAAAYRWGRALGFVQETPAGLPEGAYEGGPATDREFEEV